MDTIVNLLTENSFWTLIASIVVIAFIISVLKSLFKVAITISVIALILVVFFDFKPQEVIDKGKGIAEKGSEIVEGGVKPLLANLSKDDLLLKQEIGETIVEIDSLGIEYNLNDLSFLGEKTPSLNLVRV